MGLNVGQVLAIQHGVAPYRRSRETNDRPHQCLLDQIVDVVNSRVKRNGHRMRRDEDGESRHNETLFRPCQQLFNWRETSLNEAIRKCSSLFFYPPCQIHPSRYKTALA